MTAAARPRGTAEAWLIRRPATRRIYDSVQRHLVALPTIRLPLQPADGVHELGASGYRLSVSRRMCGAVVVVAVVGDVRTDGAGDLEHRLQRILTRGDLSRLVVDLTRVGLLSDAGLRVLLRAHDTGRTTGIPLRVVTGNGGAGAVLDTCDFRCRIPTAPNVDSACADGFRRRGEVSAG